MEVCNRNRTQIIACHCCMYNDTYITTLCMNWFSAVRVQRVTGLQSIVQELLGSFLHTKRMFIYEPEFRCTDERMCLMVDGRTFTTFAQPRLSQISHSVINSVISTAGYNMQLQQPHILIGHHQVQHRYIEKKL